MKFEKLFEPGRIGTLETKNRFVVPPMLTEYAATDGHLTERYIRYYEEKAKGGWGLVICEDNSVDPYGAGFENLAGIWSDDLMAEHRELVRRVHAHGAKIAVQAYHAGRESDSAITGRRPVAPSPIQDPTERETPRELTTEEVGNLVEEFAQAVRRCKEAGYDAVELHGAHGYLINQFVSPFSNKRTDRYGGNPRNRLRFPLEIIARAKELVGDDYPIIYRISADEMVPGGLTIEDTKVIARQLEEAGVAALHVSAGVYKSGAIVSAPSSVRTAPFSDYARQIRGVVSIPVFAVDKIAYPELAESLLEEGKADFVSMGRASIADPELPNKVRDGRLDEILPCVGCWQGCQGKIARQEAVSCLVNPRTGKEDAYAVKPAREPKRVMVVGGGPGGMEAAIVAARRGHDVTLWEKDDRLGGQWLLAAIPPGKEALNSFTVWQMGELERHGVTLHTGTAVDADLVRRENPDVVVIATGATQKVPPIPGMDGRDNVVMANDVLSGRVDLAGDAVVIGGGTVGAETAEHIAVHNHKVSIVKRSPGIAADMAGAPREFLLRSLRENDVDIYEGAKTLEIGDGFVRIEKDGSERMLPADMVVIASGSSPDDALAREVEGERPVKVIGDAVSVRKALDAIDEGYQAGLAI
jgi:2,4-dienoyl-CoA reductase-like NADH-dependent reductase (Old Yellow Enzyme family)/thioredoxin reductase